MEVFYPYRIDTYSPIGTIFREVGTRLPYSVTAFTGDNSSDFTFGDINVVYVGDRKKDWILQYILKGLSSGQYDLVHTGPVSHHLATGLGAMRGDATHIHTIHNAEWGIHRGLHPYVHRRLMMSLCDGLTAVSPYVVSKIKQHTNFRRSPVVIPNGVDINQFRQDRAETIPKKVLYVGRAVNRKHPEIVYQLAERMCEFSFEVRIKHLEKKEELKSKMESLKNVRILNRLSSDELASQYASASVFIAPYEREAFGMTVLESLASGTPIVGLKRGNIPNLIMNGKGGIVINSLSTDDWQRGVAEISANTSDFSTRKIALKFSWDAIAKEYKSYYKDVL
jgi:glycosyltransferase involved in cell wall biosynthesis